MNVKDACLKKNTVRRKRMHVRPVKPVIENDSEKELQQQNANEMHQKMKNCKKADKTALRSAKGPQTAEKAESEKRGRFHSPVFHITCIIRNICNQKNRSPLPSTFEFGDPFVSASSGTGSFCRYISFCSIQGKSGQLFRLRLCAKVFTDCLIINACRFFTAFFAAEPCCIGFIRYKALFCQYSRTVYVF